MKQAVGLFHDGSNDLGFASSKLFGVQAMHERGDDLAGGLEKVSLVL